VWSLRTNVVHLYRTMTETSYVSYEQSSLVNWLTKGVPASTTQFCIACTTTTGVAALRSRHKERILHWKTSGFCRPSSWKRSTFHNHQFLLRFMGRNRRHSTQHLPLI